jgi:methyl-accepting chemotaxis protein
MKLELKLGINTGVLILAMSVSACIAHLRVKQADELSATITNQRLPNLVRVRDIRFHAMASVQYLQSYMLLSENNPAASAQFSKKRKAEIDLTNLPFQELIDQPRLFGLGVGTTHIDDVQFGLGPGVSRIEDIQSDLLQFAAIEAEVERLNELHTPDSTRQAYDLLQRKILAMDSRLFVTLHAYAAAQQAQGDRENAKLHQAHLAVLITLWTTTLLGAIVGGIVSFLIARQIVRGIEIVAARADAIASGDLTGGELDLDSADQIGSLAHAMQRMQASLVGIIGTVAQTAGSLAVSAVSMRSASDQIHHRVDQQTQQTRQAATAMQEMSVSIAEVSRHSQSAAETARSAAKTARDGGDIVKGMLNSMQSIAADFRQTSSTVGLLGEDSRRISQIVTVIDEIARKTNLLALNAAIEAARAGEEGRGFAVVAGEVRRLAESTAQATSEISAMVQGIQARSRTAIACVASGSLTVEQGVATTGNAGEALERIIGMAERVDRMIAQIAIATSQQAAAADQSSASLTSIDTLSHENLSALATTAAGIESLGDTAVTLELQVERFRLQQPPPAQAAASPLPWQEPYPAIA